MKPSKFERRAICGICSAGCWVIVTYDENGRIKNVRADETSPLGSICKVGEHSPEIVYSKDRLHYPMKRKGPKGSLEFERITWEEAYDRIVDRLNLTKAESGPEATAVYTGSGSFELAFCDMYQPAGVTVSSAASVLFPFGSPNTLGVGALCYVSFAMIAPHVTMGRMYIDMFSDIENAELIVVWGKNPAAHCPRHDFNRINEAHRRGAQIIVIDPRKTLLAGYAGARWIPIRPGTDGALALGMCSVLIEEELYDADFVDKWITGFEEFGRYTQHFRPEVVETITGIPAETIRFLARRIAAADGAAPVMYSGLEYSDGAVQAIRATMVLWALAGQLDVPGGSCFSMPQNQFPINRKGLVENPNVKKAAGHNKFPVYTHYRGEFHASILPRAVLEKDPYPIRLLISLGASIVTSWPQSELWRKTLGALDFLVCIDRQLTADAAYADIVLPSTTYYEIESYMRYGPLFRIRERVIDPVGEARNDFFIFSELARRLGYGHLYPQNESELLERALQDSGFTPQEVRDNGGTVQVPTKMMEYRKWQKGLLRKDGNPGFDTPTTKFEISSTLLAEYGYDALPVYTEPAESPISQPALARTFPLVFNSGARSNVDIHTLNQTIPALGKEKPFPTVMMNTIDAEQRDIKDGDLVRLKTRRGRVNLYARVSDNIMAGAVEASAMGGGALGAKAWRDACINDLTDLNRFDPISGFPVYKALLCEVTKISKGNIGSAGGTEEHDIEDIEVSSSSERLVYLDHNATTPMAAEVRDAIINCLDCYGNASSIYGIGKKSHSLIEDARRSLALLINSTAYRIIFTGCGSEANNLAVKGIAFLNHPHKNHIITTTIEHPSILNTFEWLQRMGFETTFLSVDDVGRVDPDMLEKSITKRTCLVSVMLANNETGSIQPVRELAAIAREHGVPFHTDAVQAVGKIPVDVENLNVDLLSLSAHKFHGPKGIGALYVRKGIDLFPLINGGHQENGLRSGTENLIGIVGLGRASQLAMARFPRMEGVGSMRDRLQSCILDLVPGARVNGCVERRLPNTLNITLPEIRGESLVLALDRNGVAVSSGSACQSGHPDPSSALTAMGLSAEEAHCSIRFSLGVGTTEDDIDRTITAMDKVIRETKEVIRFVSCR